MRVVHLTLWLGVFAQSFVLAGEDKPFMSFYNPPATPIALEQHQFYESPSMHTKVGFNLYLPPGYAEPGNTQRYPVIYWLHGRGCSESNDQFPVGMVEAAIRSNAIPPLIFVYASGGGMSFYSDSVDGRWLAETTLIKELIPHVDAHYRTIPNRGGRAIQGMSMGGFGAMKLALKYPELFSSVVAFAGGYRNVEGMRSDGTSREILDRVFGGDPQQFMANHPATIARTNADGIRGRLGIKMLIGLDDYLLENNRALHATLTEFNLPHEYWEVPAIKHDLPRLAAWIGSDGLQFAARHFSGPSGQSSGATLESSATDPLATAVECQKRGGLPNVLQKLNRGAEVRVAYLGGSITAQDGWRPKSLDWLRGQFPTAKLSEINAAIGGTGSDLGVFRLRHDVLDHHPDLLFVEFAVNDAGASPSQIYRCMEGIVRQTWKDNAETDICFVYTIAGNMLQTLQEGQLPRSTSAMEKVADHYGIPSIHLGWEVARLEKAGKLIFKGEMPKTDAEKSALGEKILFSPDAVHPYPDSGHQLYLEVVIRSFEQLRHIGRTGAHPVPAPLVADNWERAQMISFDKARLSSEWHQLNASTNRLAKAFEDRLPGLWQARSAGEYASFRFRGTTVRIYDLLGPDCGQVTIVVDDQPPVVKPRFDAFCTYHRLATLSVGEDLTDQIHTVKISVHPEQPDKARILSERGEKIDDPKRFDGTAWYAGGILLIGELMD